MARNWMRELARHYERMRQRHPSDRLMIVFDIDGTILDMRYMIAHVLKEYDRAHGTHHFDGLQPEAIHVHENQVHLLLEEMGLPPEVRQDVLRWYRKRRWTPVAIRHSHRPFRGVLEVIRWFQIQPNTYVGLNTGRPEYLREETLRSLNTLGRAHGVHFDDELLHMNPQDWEEDVAQAKVAGIRYFQERGYRVFAYVDNEPENLAAVAEYDRGGEILLLHADTLFESRRDRLPARSVTGHTYELVELIPERRLPRRVQFVWHGINDHANLRQFLAAENVRWGEFDVQLDPETGHQVVLRHDRVEEAPLSEEEELLTLDYVLTRIRERGKAVKLDLKNNGRLVVRVLELVDRFGFRDEELWFNAEVDLIGPEGFRKLHAAHPGAILQCPIDHLASTILTDPGLARAELERYRSWGINRFSISWFTPELRAILDQMDGWGYEVNIYDIPDLEAFLRAVLLLPRSVTADFNFPQWHYYGRGSGHKGRHYEYLVREVNVREESR